MSSMARRGRRETLRTLVLAALLVCLSGPPAFACPVCGTAETKENGQAYVTMTIVMSLLPLGMIGGVVVWVARRARRDRGEDE